VTKRPSYIWIGLTFMFNGIYCEVIKMYNKHFEFKMQERDGRHYMSYDFYKTTPSFFGRQLNKR